MKRLRLPITMSLVIHAILAGLLFFSTLSLYRLETGGSGAGGVVSVWIAGPDGEEPGYGPKNRLRPEGDLRKIARSPSPEKTMKIDSGRDSERAEEKSVAEAGSERGSAAGGSLSTGSGGSEGVGSGRGEGIGSGLNGNPALARIWKRINRSKYYPEVARNRGLEGSPRVTFTIEKDGSVGSVVLATSCGEAMLDDAARETIRRAAPLPFYPGPITLTVKYSLSD